jgi:predicted MFS family arabinose efflux permease
LYQQLIAKENMRKNVIIMNILVAFFSFSQFCYMPNLPQYAQSLGADALVLGVIGGVFGIAQILLRIPLGLISDNTGKDRQLMVIGAVVLTASCGILLFANNTDFIVLGRLIAGGAAAWWSLQTVIYGNYHRDEIQVKAQGMLSASANWGKVAACVAGGLIAQYLGMHAIFIFAFIVAALCIFLSFGLKNGLENPKPAQIKPSITYRKLLPLLKNRDMIVFSLLTTISVLLFVTGPTYFTLVAAQNLGATSMDFGLLNAVCYLFSGMICLWVGSRVYKKIGNIHAIAFGFIITGAACIPNFYHISLPVIYLIQAISGVGTGISCTAIAGLVMRVFPQKERGVSNGIFQSIVAIGTLIGPMLVGSVMKAISFDASYWLLVIIAAVAALMSYLLVPKKYAKM